MVMNLCLLTIVTAVVGFALWVIRRNREVMAVTFRVAPATIAEAVDACACLWLFAAVLVLLL